MTILGKGKFWLCECVHHPPPLSAYMDWMQWQLQTHVKLNIDFAFYLAHDRGKPPLCIFNPPGFETITHVIGHMHQVISRYVKMIMLHECCINLLLLCLFIFNLSAVFLKCRWNILHLFYQETWKTNQKQSIYFKNELDLIWRVLG